MTTNRSGVEDWRHAPFHDRPIGHATTVPSGKSTFPFFPWKVSSRCPLTDLGCVLASAIWNGALLDPRKWQPWLAGLAVSRPFDTQRWVTMKLTTRKEGAGARDMQDRWFADPRSKLHINNYKSRYGDDRTTIDSHNAIEVLEAFFEATRWEWPSVDAFYDAACARWRLRLPALLFDFAMGRTGTTSLSEYSWRRLIGMKANRAFKQAFVPRAQLEAFRAQQKANRRKLRSSFPEASRVFLDVWQLQRRGVIDKMAAARRLCAEWLQDIDRTRLTPAKQTLIEWCAFRLRQKRSAKFRRGFAPSTMYFRLSCVFAAILKYKASNRKFVLNLASFKGVAARALADQTNPYVHEELEASCFDLFDYLYEVETGQALPRERGQRHKTQEDQTAGSLCDEDEDDDDYLAVGDKPPRGVCADIVSEAVYTDLLDHINGCKEAPDGALVVAILGYRCGLRLNEITGARIGDFVSDKKFLELQLDRSSQRWLKTFDSRRVLPLHVFLSEAEMGVIQTHLRLRLLLTETLQRNLPLLGPVCTRALPDGERYETYIDECLEKLGRRGLKFQNFRHSFGSLTLTNLLLPDDFHGDEVVQQLSHSLSLDRRDRLLDAMVGRERLGQASLHAVSLAMGHTGIQMTLDAYQHLLNFSLGLYVESRTDYRPSRSVNDDGPGNDGGPASELRISSGKRGGQALYVNPIQTHTYLRSSSASLSIKQVVPHRGSAAERQALARTTLRAKSETLASTSFGQRGQLDWYLIFYLATADDEVAKKLRRFCHIERKQVAQWRRLSGGLAQKLNNSRKNTVLTVPRGAEALWLLNKLWLGLPAQLTDLERRLVGTFVWNFDKRNSFARFLNVADAVVFRRMLIRWGAEPDDLRIDEARGLNRRASASRKVDEFDRTSPDYDGYGAISIERNKTKEDSMGWSVDLKRHRQTRQSGEPTDRGRHRHRHVVYAYKFFLAMVALREGITPLELPHANSRARRS